MWVLRGLRNGVLTTRWPRRRDAYADGVRRTGGGGEFFLEGADFRTEDEPAAGDHAIDRPSHVAGVLARHQRHERDSARGHGLDAAGRFQE